MPVNPVTCWQYIAKGLQKIPWSPLSAGKPYSLLWVLCLQGEAMKDFDLVTCTNLDSAEFKKKWKEKHYLPETIKLKALAFASLEKILPQMPEKYMAWKYWIHYQQ